MKLSILETKLHFTFLFSASFRKSELKNGNAKSVEHIVVHKIAGDEKKLMFLGN